MKLTLCILALVLPVLAYAESFSSMPETSEQPEGCRAEDMKSWSKLYYANPDDNDVLGLFVLHRKLCELVIVGEDSEDRASDIFETWCNRLILERDHERGVLFDGVCHWFSSK
jgi:hypothetical protein